MVRKERRVVIGGRPELWRLEWRTPPQPVCGPDSEDWWTCPCSGFAFGETGKLDLVRLREGHEVERFPLAPLFDSGEPPTDTDNAVLRRWDVRKSDWKYTNLEQPGRPTPVPGVRTRAQATAMKLADYDHDGHATEFFLQTETPPCGKHIGVVVGVSEKTPRLHGFGTALRPDKPLLMSESAWTALVQSQGSARVVVWACGDHASDHETELELSATSGEIRVTNREFQCSEDDKREQLISEEPL